MEITTKTVIFSSWRYNDKTIERNLTLDTHDCVRQAWDELYPEEMLRQIADLCNVQAILLSQSQDDQSARDNFQYMRRALLELADNFEWQEGRSGGGAINETS